MEPVAAGGAETTRVWADDWFLDVETDPENVVPVVQVGFRGRMNTRWGVGDLDFRIQKYDNQHSERFQRYFGMRQIKGPLSTLLVAICLLLLKHTEAAIPNGSPILILPVIYSVFVSGQAGGLISGVIAMIFTVVFFAQGSIPFSYTEANVKRVVVLEIVIPVLVVLAIVLKNRLESATLRIRDIAETLRESQEKYRIIAENSVDLIAILSPSGVLRYASPSYYHVLGFLSRDIEERPIFSLLHPEDVAGAQRRIAEMVQSRKPRRAEFRYRHRHGGMVYVEAHGIPVIGPDGTVNSILTVARDISEKKQILSDLRKSEQKYRIIAEYSMDLIAIADMNGQFMFASASFETVLGYSPKSLEGTSIFQMVVPEDRARVAHEFGEMLHSNLPRLVEFSYLHCQGHSLYLEAYGRPVVDPDGRVQSVVIVARDITERIHAEAVIEQLAYHDSLTGLPNRRLISERLSMALDVAAQKSGILALIFVDIDRFKEINDTMGHAFGDKVLAATAQRLLACTHGSGTVIGRIAGDEFVVLLPEVTVRDDVLDMASKIHAEFRRPMDLDGHRLHVTPSMGIAIYPEDGTDADALLTNADTAMYRAKESQHHFVLYSSAMSVQARRRHQLINDLYQALERGQMFLTYQPRIRTIDGEIGGVEALLRWRHPELGMVSPTEFIPLAEETGLILPIGEWVLRMSCLQSVDWLRQGLPPIRIAVNCSPRQFHSGNLPDIISQLLNDTGVNASALEIEITESAVIKNEENTEQQIRKLKIMGIAVSIDDFGTGYASLSYLNRFRFDYLKIDRSFISGLTRRPRNDTIAASIISLSHGLQMKVVAEGVETDAQLTFLREHGCDEVQGFLFSPPVAPERIVALRKDQFAGSQVSKTSIP